MELYQCSVNPCLAKGPMTYELANSEASLEQCDLNIKETHIEQCGNVNLQHLQLSSIKCQVINQN